MPKFSNHFCQHAATNDPSVITTIHHTANVSWDKAKHSWLVTQFDQKTGKWPHNKFAIILQFIYNIYYTNQEENNPVPFSVNNLPLLLTCSATPYLLLGLYGSLT
jgi:hypothetical protein